MTLLSDKLSLIGLLVILLEVALVVLVVSPEQARRARVAEQETATAVFGAPLAARATRCDGDLLGLRFEDEAAAGRMFAAMGIAAAAQHAA